MKLLTIFWLYYFSFLPTCFSQKQESIPPTQYFNFKTYGKAQELNVNMVSAIAEDNRGMIWLVTDGGLFKFDGRKFIEAKGGDTARFG